MKKLLLFVNILLTLAVSAQTYNNEWIDYSKTYYKFGVGSDAVYRISQPALVAAGLGAIPAEQFQLWRNGEQVRLYTSVNSGPLAGSDYIEFWGQQNDGKPDKALYRLPGYQLNEKWSLQTDTAAYFLTVNPAGGNLRFETVANNVAGNTLPAEPYFMHREGVYYKNKINPGKAVAVGEYLYSSSYDIGEGYTSADIDSVKTLTASFTNMNVATSAPESITLSVAAVGNAIYPRKVGITLNGNTVEPGATMDYFDVLKRDYSLPLSMLSGNTANVIFDNIASINVDRMSVSFCELRYPRLFNFGNSKNFAFTLSANASGNYLEIKGFANASVAPVLLDITNGVRYVGDISTASTIKFVLAPSAVDRQLVLINQAQANILSITGLKQRQFIDYGQSSQQGDFLIISNKILMDDGAGHNPVEDYKAYRNSLPGGSHSAHIYDIDQLVDQFAFGIKKHPLSIRNFIQYALQNYSIKPAYVFLIGKGVTYTSYRTLENSNVTNQQNAELLNLVPTYGYPASDNLLAAPSGSSLAEIPVGRLSVVYAYEINDYLNKVKEYESAQKVNSCDLQTEAWKKNVIHVVGASDENLGTILDNYMTKYKSIISDSIFGANVSTFSKNSPDAVELAASERLKSIVEQGTSLILYFGHSSSTTLEFNLDNPENYNNQGKYPVFIALGCNAGNFYGASTTRFFAKETLSEKFTLAPNRGTIAYVASSNFGIVHYLDLLNSKAYDAITRSKYGESIGAVYHQMAEGVFGQLTQNDFYARFHVEQTILHGDPSIKFNSEPKPDFVLDPTRVKIDPEFVSIADNKVHLEMEVINQGRVENDTLLLTVNRKYPNSTEEEIIRDSIIAPKYSTKLKYEILMSGVKDIGTSTLTITLDPLNKIDEFCETNNSVVKSFTIYEDEARPIYPYNYAIVQEATPTFVASTANIFALKKKYYFELDTSSRFNSQVKRTLEIEAEGGILEFNPSVVLQDSTVYYWRVSPDSDNGERRWRTSSFIYYPGHGDGFNQSHLGQFQNDDLTGLGLDTNTIHWRFTKAPVDFFMKSGVFPTAFSQASGFTLTINNETEIRNVCGVSGIIFNVIDPVTLLPWYNAPGGSPGRYGSDNVCGSGVSARAYNFQYNILDPAKRAKAVAFLDSIPDGYFVVVRNISGTTVSSNTYASTWANDTLTLGPNNSIYHRLKAQGFADIDSFYKPRAFGFVYQKNTPSFGTKSAFSEGVYDPISFSIVGETIGSKGKVTSETFGPANAWHTLKWKGHSDDGNTVSDISSVDVFGVNNQGIETPLLMGLDINNPEVNINWIPAKDFPYLRLRLNTLDTVALTPFQLEHWRVLYDPVPEGALAPNLSGSLKDTLDLGEPFQFNVAFKNVSKEAFDSIKVRLTVTDNANRATVYPLGNLKPLAPGDTANIQYKFDTQQMGGANSFFLEVNPDYAQPEQYLFNNYGYKKFYVKPDSLNPLLDVTFDGVHILNSDIVSAKPKILIRLTDETKWMVLNDTTLMSMKIKYPSGQLKPFYFSQIDTVRFQSAGAAPTNDNSATIELNPTFTEDGEYELQLDGNDRSFNKAGKSTYRISFQVINKPMISNLINYPNPFTSSTAFVFTLTGTEVPQNIKIEIMTVTGKIVREITKEELGPLHIGRNITEFKWDGTDQFGQKLANGIYLYRVVTNLNGKQLDKYKAQGDDTDRYFNKGYGKMYLMR